MSAPRPGFAPNAYQRWIPVALIGVVAVIAGIFLPQSMPSSATVSQTPPAPQPAGKQDLVYTPTALPDAPDAKSMLTRLALGTATVLGLCVGTLWLGRYWLNGGVNPAAGAKQLQLLESLSLGNRCSVHLLQLGQQAVLVGADSSGLKVIVPLQPAFEQKLSAVQGHEIATAEEEKPVSLFLHPGAYVESFDSDRSAS
jgi:flagellar biogenesis protein FliO